MKHLTFILVCFLTLQIAAQVPAGEIPPAPTKSEPQSENYVYTITEEVPEFPGGIKAMNEFLKAKLRYPSYSLESGINGTSVLKFIVDKTGDIKELQVLRGMPGCKECDDAAIAAVKEMPKWKPAKMDGKKVNCWFSLPVTFNRGKPADVKSH